MMDGLLVTDSLICLKLPLSLLSYVLIAAGEDGRTVVERPSGRNGPNDCIAPPQYRYGVRVR